MKPKESSLARLLADLAEAGLRLKLENKNSLAVGPSGRLSPDLRERLTHLKPDVIEMLRIYGGDLVGLFRRKST